MRFGNATIYYDGGCNFCRRGVRFLHRVLFLPWTRVLPGQTDPDITRIMTERDSWVVVDSKGGMHTDFEAGVALVRASPVFFFLAPLGRLLFIAHLGERLSIRREPSPACVRT